MTKEFRDLNPSVKLSIFLLSDVKIKIAKYYKANFHTSNFSIICSSLCVCALDNATTR